MAEKWSRKWLQGGGRSWSCCGTTPRVRIKMMGEQDPVVPPLRGQPPAWGPPEGAQLRFCRNICGVVAPSGALLATLLGAKVTKRW